MRARRPGRTRDRRGRALGVPESAIRVVARDVGGNFGTRNSCYPEFALVAWAARRVGRPVKWTSERREAFQADYQGRDLVSHAELALDDAGTFLAFRGVNTSNLGSHAVSFHPLNKGVAIATTSITCRRCRCAGAPSSPPPRRPPRTAAPGAPR
jgi:carbon-monoxide dehydrogenase large subunit